jgi:hypothetical protein
MEIGRALSSLTARGPNGYGLDLRKAFTADFGAEARNELSPFLDGRGSRKGDLSFWEDGPGAQPNLPPSGRKASLADL